MHHNRTGTVGLLTSDLVGRFSIPVLIGLVVVGDTNPRRSLGGDIPVPVVYAHAPSDNPQDTSVISDNVGAGRLAAEHVIDYGRRHIG